MKLGVALPVIDREVGGDPAAIREFAQAAEAIGYQDLATPDHVLGVNAASRPDWGDRNTSADLFQDPFVLFGFLAACTETIEFSTQLLILAQRQTVLVAKQAACLDVLCGGRFRLGIGVGWNPVEFTGLNENFHNRGRRSEEQVQVMKALWAAPHVSFRGEWHTIEDAGINPLPGKRSVPLWYGGHDDRTLQRIAKWGDGWMPNAYPPDQSALDVFARLRSLTTAAGRISPSSAVTSGAASRQFTAAGSAPARTSPNIAVTQPTWLRAMTGTTSPGRTPAAANTAASRSIDAARPA